MNQISYIGIRIWNWLRYVPGEEPEQAEVVEVAEVTEAEVESEQLDLNTDTSRIPSIEVLDQDTTHEDLTTLEEEVEADEDEDEASPDYKSNKNSSFHTSDYTYETDYSENSMSNNFGESTFFGELTFI